ncbi:CBS domain-containing protein [Saccharothrix sp. ST-888]|uniref:CBS domain-containing protein n=1 Tax=Saccharothrix sp. ST-888 TaxID=1427391 RepID=UPI0005ECCD45|nr:CBS domain-containing protein [Saccharothrix sp. ST-888]KJK58021.1 hypoxic response protein 1 [Saccharothrix sp. ST-888]
MITARDVMHAKAQCISEEQTLMEAAKMMAKMGVGALPICGSDQKLKGIITDRDIVIECIAKGKDPATMKAIDLGGHLHCVRADDTMEMVLKKMKDHQIRRIPVIDNEKLVGMISEADLAAGHMMGKGLTDQMIVEFMDGVYAKR